MAEDWQFLVLYVYEQVTIGFIDPPPNVTAYRLVFEDVEGEKQFGQTRAFELAPVDRVLDPGVYGWFASEAVQFSVDGGHAIIATARKGGKDPWPPPPPPPPTPDFANDPLALRQWALHWVGRDGEAFLSGLGG